MASITIIIATLSALVCITYQAIPTKYLIEVYFVVDRTVVDRYISELHDSGVTGPTVESKARKRLNADILYMVGEIRKLYQTLKRSGMDIDVGVRKIELIPQRLIPDLTEFTKALKLFHNWLGSTHPARDKGQDVTILWTGNRFAFWDYAGLAFFKKVCTDYKWAVAVIPYTMTYRTAWVTASEIARLLGVYYDTYRESLMAPHIHYGPNRWTFTMRSKQEIEAYLKTLPNKGKNCLQNRHPLTKLVSGRITPELNDMDTLCRRALRSPKSYECRSKTYLFGQHICGHLKCRRKHARGCDKAMASEGMTCMFNRKCYLGRCLPDNKGAGETVVTLVTSGVTSSPASELSESLHSDNCVFADSLQRNCTNLLKQHGSGMCTNPDNFWWCCQTCNDANAAQKIKDSDPDRCKGEVSSFNKASYCASLDYLGYKPLCYNTMTRRLCCEACYEDYTIIPGCEFGDRSNLCEGVVESNLCHIKENAKTCCQSCSRAQARKRSADIIGAVENFDNRSLEDQTFVVEGSDTYRLP